MTKVAKRIMNEGFNWGFI